MDSITLKQFPLFSFKFVKAYIVTMRPYLMFVSGITGIVGMSFSNNIDLTKAFLIFLASFLSYGFGQALTDCFQTDTDSISSPYRPLTQGIVNRNHFLIISAIGLCSVTFIFTIFNPVNLLLGILGGIGLSTYTYFKRKWWAGPFYNAWIVVVLFLMSYSAGREDNYPEFKNPLFIAAILTVFFGYANFVLTGYFKDIDADRATNYNTLLVIYGRKLSSGISDVFAFIASASVFTMSLIAAYNSLPFLVLAYGGIGTSILAQLNLHMVKNDNQAHKAIIPCVHSYILLLSGLAVINKPDWFIPILLFYIIYLIIMKIRPVKEQI